MRRTTLATLAAMCVLLVALAGCGGDPKPKHAKSALPTPTPSASATPTPTDPVPPVMPAAARKHTVAGAKAFTRYFAATVTYGTIALDPGPLKEISSDYCDGCSAAIATAQRYVKKRATVVGGTWTLRSITVDRLKAGSHVLMRVTAAGTYSRQIINYPGGSKDVFPGGPTKDRLILVPTADGWSVDTWTVIS